MSSKRHGRRRERERARHAMKGRSKRRRLRREKVWETSAITEHLRGHGAQPDMEQSQISIRPNQEYTPPPPLALFFPQEGGGEDSAHLAPSFPSRAEVEALLGVGAWPAVLVTVPKLPQNGPLRSLPPSLPSLSLPLLPSLRIDVLVRITTHPRHVPSIRLLTYLPSFDHRLHSAPSPSTRSARFPRFSNSVNVTAETTSVRGSRDRVHRTDSFRALLLEYTCLDTCSPVSIVVIIGQKKDRSSSRVECASSPTPLLSIRIYGKEERSFMLPESKFPVTGKFERCACELIYDTLFDFSFLLSLFLERERELDSIEIEIEDGFLEKSPLPSTPRRLDIFLSIAADLPFLTYLRPCQLQSKRMLGRVCGHETVLSTCCP